MRIGLDVMGGDLAPDPILQGGFDALSLLDEGDRLVLFASARVPHAVESRARDAAGRRVAASFWFLGDPRAVGPRESDAS